MPVPLYPWLSLLQVCGFGVWVMAVIDLRLILLN